MRNPLLDLDFLKQLDQNRHKTTYAKIILLTFDEHPIQEIQGTITSGSINIDGNSSVRRTCSLSMVTNDPDINETYWTLKNKFKLEVGVKNNINPNYPDIIWFPQGYFVFSSINMSVQQSNYTINLQGKDKMCLLNGELGGAIVAQTNFGVYEEYKTLGSGEIIREVIDQPIIDIVKNMVHLYGGQPLESIILNDIEEYGLELLEYRADEPMYMLRSLDGQIENISIDKKQSYYHITDYDKTTEQPLSWETQYQLGEISTKNFYNFVDIDSSNDNAWKFFPYSEEQWEKKDESQLDANWPKEVQEFYITWKQLSKDQKEKKSKVFYLSEITEGKTCGYRLTDLTYPGDLIANVGESITSILDKIKSIFSDFEYFYDLDGRFVFQKKKTYVNTSWNNLQISDKEIYADDAMYTSSVVYSFEQGVLLNSFNNNPQIGDIKNDYSIWGKRTSVSGAEIPVHLRYAIENKPMYYKPVRWERDLDGNIKNPNQPPQDLPPYVTEEWRLAHPTVLTAAANTVDWREIIYQMSLDFYAFDYRIENFKEYLADYNPDYYPTGKTGYENYYMDMNSLWRELYNPYLYEDYEKLKDKANASLEGEELNKRLEELEKEYQEKLEEYQYNSSSNRFWNINVSEYPENLNFWFDFLDADDAELSKYAVSVIGTRPKAENNDKIKAIYYENTPDVLFLTIDDYMYLVNNFSNYTDMTGYTFIRLTPQMENYFKISAKGISAYDQLDSLLYQHTYASESVTLTAVPIYYLQPNNRIFINDTDTKIQGEYIVSKITIPLQYNGTTSITATKAIERIY